MAVFAMALVMVCCIVAGARPVHAADDWVAQGASPRVRAVTSAIRRALAIGYSRSISFRTLVDALESSDLIVHLVSGRPAWPGAHGELSFAGARATTRYVRIQVDSGLPPEVLAGLIGHELYHAYEVARATQVRDQTAFQALYERIGISGCSGRARTCYDTTAAQRAGWQVAYEVAHHPTARRAVE